MDQITKHKYFIQSYFNNYLGDIGYHKDEKESEKLKLTPEDQSVYNDWPYVSNDAYQNEIVEFLMFEEANVSTYVYILLVQSKY